MSLSITSPSDWFSARLQACEKSLREIAELGSEHKEKRRPCGFFHYTGLATERLQDCCFILNRMDRQRTRLTALDKQEWDAHRDLGAWPAGKPYPEEMQRIMRAQDRLIKGLKLDFESLYLFGMMLLDQWALIAKCIGGVKIAKKHPFNEVVELFETGKAGNLGLLWTSRAEQVLWLFHNFRVFRNVFVAHSVSTWQRGTSRAIQGTSFTMFIPSPPEHRVDGKETDKEILALLPLAPERIRNAPPDYWERARPARLLEVLFDGIGNLSRREDRLKVEQLYKRRGGETPTYQTVGTRLLEFVQNGLGDLLSLLKNNPTSLDLDYVDDPAFSYQAR